MNFSVMENAHNDKATCHIVSARILILTSYFLNCPREVQSDPTDIVTSNPL